MIRIGICSKAGLEAQSRSETMVRAATGQVIVMLVGNGLDNPRNAAFDGQTIPVTNFGGTGQLAPSEVGRTQSNPFL